MSNDLARKRNVYHALLWFLVVFTALTVGAALVTQGILLMRLNALVEANQRDSALLIDCTTPGGECYEEGNRRTGDAIGDINKVTIAATVCSKRPENQTYGQMRACIEQELKGI